MISGLGLSRKAPKVSLLTLMLLMSATTSVLAYSDPQSTPSGDDGNAYSSIVGDAPVELAEELLSLMEASRAQVIASLNQLSDDGFAIPEASLELLRSGDEAAGEAFRYMEAGDYQSVVDRATEALQLYGEAIRLALCADQEAAEEDGGVNAALVGLKERIERGYSFSSELNATMQALSEMGLDVSFVQFLLETASEHLEHAAALLDEADLEAVESELAMAEACLEAAFELLQAINGEVTVEKAAKFLEKSEERVQKLEERITKLLGNISLTQDDAALLGDSFDDAQAKNREIRALIEGGELDTAVAEFDEVSRYIDRILAMLERYDSGKSNNLKRIEKIETMSSLLGEAIESLNDQGVDISQLGGKVEEVSGKIEEAIESLTEDDVEGADTLIDEAEDMVDEVDDTVSDLKKNSKEGHQKGGKDDGPRGGQG